MDNTNKDQFSLKIFYDYFGTDTALVVQSLKLFTGGIPELYEKIRNDIENNDNGGLAMNAHSMKGYIAYFTKDTIYLNCLALETIGKKNGLPEMHNEAINILGAIGASINDLLSFINAELSKLE